MESQEGGRVPLRKRNGSEPLQKAAEQRKMAKMAEYEKNGREFFQKYLGLVLLGHGGVLDCERGVGGDEPLDRVHGLAVPLLQLGLGEGPVTAAIGRSVAVA